jgi:hypothetical protein
MGFLLAVPDRAKGGVVPGDFEAKLGSLLVKVAISTAPGKEPVFSAQVVSGGTSQTVSGAFKTGVDWDWEGAILLGDRITKILLRYSRVVDGTKGLYERLEVGFDGIEWVGAGQAYKPDGSTVLAKAYSMAYKIGQRPPVCVWKATLP